MSRFFDDIIQGLLEAAAMNNKTINSWDDFPEWIKDLVKAGICTREEVIMRYEPKLRKEYGLEQKEQDL